MPRQMVGAAHGGREEEALTRSFVRLGVTAEGGNERKEVTE